MTEKTTELRGECPRDIVNVLDAVSSARGVTRTDLVNAILAKWAQRVVHEHIVIARVVGSNPTVPESPVRRNSAFVDLEV